MMLKNQRYTRWATVGALAVILAMTACQAREEATSPPPVDASAGDVDRLPQSEPANASPISPSPTPSTPSTTPTPIPTATPSPTPTPAPTATAMPTSTPTPALRQLTTGGCCTQPFWSPDSRQVLFIDQPAPDAPLGIWAADTTQPDAAPELFTEHIAFYTADLAYIVETGPGTTTIERVGEGERWTVPAAGRRISISPDRTRIAWGVSDDNLPFERRSTQVWVANLDGADAQMVATLPRGGLSGWISDDVLLLSGRESLESRETALSAFSLTDGSTVELIRSSRPRGTLLSPDGRWLAYYVTQGQDPAENGLWLARTDGSEGRQLDQSLFGAYQWRDAHRLLIVPFRPEAVWHELWEYDLQTDDARRLTDPDVTPFKIANGDWRTSPDGRHVAFVETQDRNIWLLTLGD